MKDKAIQITDNNDTGNLLDLKIQPVRDIRGQLTNGLTIGKTLEQNKAFILIAQPGDFKADLTLGVGIEDMLLSDAYLEYRHKIREHFNKDGLQITNLQLYPNRPVKIEANYG